MSVSQGFAPAVARVTYRRYVILALLASMTFLNYLDRAVLSMAAPLLKQIFGLSPVQVGYCCRPSSGATASACCRRACCSTASAPGASPRPASPSGPSRPMLTGLSVGYVSLFVTRLLLGAGEAPTFPVGARVVREWAPLRERGLATAVLTGGITAGTALGSLGIAWLIEEVSWRGAFLISGALGFVWVAAWLLLFRSPERASWLPPQERAMILATRGNETATELDSVTLRQLLRSRTLWGITLTQGLRQLYPVPVPDLAAELPGAKPRGQDHHVRLRCRSLQYWRHGADPADRRGRGPDADAVGDRVG